MTMFPLNYNAFYEDLRALIRIPSVSNHDAVAEALKYFIEKSRTMGLNGYTVLDHQVGVVEMGQGEETVGVLVHVDVVDAGPLEEWIDPPFDLTEKDQKLYGRGVADDKGPAMLMLHVMALLKPLESQMKKKLQLIIGTMEEVKWQDLEAYTRYFKVPDYGFTPDGEFPITNMEKGYADIEFVFKIENPGAVRYIASGQSVNSVPGEAIIHLNEWNHFSKASYMEIENVNDQMHLKFITESVHSSKPMKGVNAIWELTRFLVNHELDLGDYKALFEFISEESLDDYHGVKIGFPEEPMLLNGQKLDSTIFIPTKIDMRADEVVLTFNVRQNYGVTESLIREVILKKQQKYGFTFEIKNYMNFLYVKPEQPFLEKMAKVYESVTGFQHEFGLAHGTSYAKAMPNFVAFGPYFPEDEDSCHEVNEHISIETLFKAGTIYDQVLKAILFTDEQLCF